MGDVVLQDLTSALPFTPPRPLETIESELQNIEAEIANTLKEMTE